VGLLALQPGETVVDLGAGAGLDAFIAARKVGPTGRVIGVDMTPEMIDKARAYAAEAGLHWVEFRRGRLEQLPVDDASVDAVTSNCVINLVPDKAAVFREVARILRPGGRLVISDIVLDGELPPAVAGDVLAYVGCVAGALRRELYFALLAAAGLSELKIHKDIDYLAAAGDTLTPELRGKLAGSGLAGERLAGIVHSVTFSAFRPA
jgi:ubiquinone/menaquinone biosynthesis C-methylase UbiE